MITHKLLISTFLLFLSSTVLALPSTTPPSTESNSNTSLTSDNYEYDDIPDYSPYEPLNSTSLEILPREEGPKTYCRNISTAEDRTSAGSPYSVDCKQIWINIRHGGSWEWGTGRNPFTVAKYGTCLVGLEPGDKVLWGNWLKVGNEDVMKIIDETLKLPFYNGEQVGSRGTMECRTTTKPHNYFKVRWGVWHT
ncbi:putative necrosis-inducing factor-domain-containing protein [Sordaria brevicollis]|uniref:Necrosis-inducing factor-domain-containing protein n=1 Tax=Sordaria brevicollis TaxID=83679 RepID=A0AAE0U9M2_SORBR|nr:putative necrosis-inducing factor-domain-containing protein [Sordaria brevicollis]